MSLGATLYVRGSVEAVEVYREAFGMTLGYHVRYDDGSFLHAELARDGATGFAVSESADAAIPTTGRPTTSLGVELADDDEVRRAYRLLSEGGRVLRPLGPLPWSPLSADLVDRFGVCWYLYARQARPDDAAMEDWLREGNHLKG
ncbi:MAG: VOC family protein [Lentisphaeria bacterium]